MVSDSRMKLGSLILLTLLGYLSLALEKYRKSEAAIEEGSDCMRETELHGWRLAHPVLILLQSLSRCATSTKAAVQRLAYRNQERQSVTTAFPLLGIEVTCYATVES